MRAPPSIALAVLAVTGCSADPAPTAAQLGGLVFHDPNLSDPAGQGCVDCHMASVAFSDPEASHTSSMGVIPGRFGPRNAPSLMYARHVPPLRFDEPSRRWVGGLFWDGRASSLEDQARVPLLNPLEMNNPDKATVVAAIRRASYAPMFRELFGPGALDDVDAAFGRVAEVVAAFERTSMFAPFSSKYDRYLAGQAALSEAEQRGLAIFEDPARGDCARCHPSRPGPDGAPPLFTDFSYANLGIPKYLNNKFLIQPPAWNPDGEHYIDHGLMQTVGDPAQDGKFRVPTLRNVANTSPYGHNGYFANLPYLIEFLSTRDLGSPMTGTCSRTSASARCAWPSPEVPATVDRTVGHLGLTDQEVTDLAAFLATLSDEAPRS